MSRRGASEFPLASGKILVAGNWRRQILVGRLTGEGKWDKTFGRRGKVAYGRKLANGRPCHCEFGQDLAVDGRGRILVAGYGYPPRRFGGGIMRLRLVRFLADGRLDRSFGRGGVVTLPKRDRFDVRRVVVGPRGRIYVSGGLGYHPSPVRFAVFAFKPNGRPDRSFFTNGRYVKKMGERSVAEAMLVDSKGRLVVAGGANKGGRATIVLKRFLLGR